MMVLPVKMSFFLQRFPIAWTHAIDQKSLQIQKLEHILVDRNMLKPPGKRSGDKSNCYWRRLIEWRTRGKAIRRRSTWSRLRLLRKRAPSAPGAMGSAVLNPCFQNDFDLKTGGASRK